MRALAWVFLGLREMEKKVCGLRDRACQVVETVEEALRQGHQRRRRRPLWSCSKWRCHWEERVETELPVTLILLP